MWYCYMRGNVVTKISYDTLSSLIKTENIKSDIFFE
jgi:hypothetical protein